MATKPVPSSLVGFTRLNHSTYILQSSNGNIPLRDTHAPDIILLCTWLDAAPKHIAKYTTGYSKLYPKSTILVLTTLITDTLASTPSSRAKRITPVLDILTSLPLGTKVLLHLFSNGGAYTTMVLGRAYAAEMRKVGKATQLPISGLILDSSPGIPEHFRTHSAMSAAFPRSPRIFYYFLSFSLHVFLLAYRFVKIVTWQKDLISEARLDLNDGRYIRKDVPRAYLYSDADVMVKEKDVELHATEAEGLGYRVITERWVGTNHCGHLMGDEGRYWKVVEGLWAISGEEQ